MGVRALATLAAVFVSSSALAVDIDTCGTVVPRRQIGVLVADLDCPPFFGVTLESGATLRLDGHTITMTNGAAVRCVVGRCTVEGPGLLDGQHIAGSGVSLHEGARLTMRDVTIRDFSGFGVFGPARNRVLLEQVTIEGTAAGGVELLEPSRLAANGLTVRNMVGLIGRAVYATSCLGADWTITDNPVARTLAQSGVSCRRARLTRLTATGNRGLGLWLGSTGTLTDSTITGNDAAGAGIDIVSLRRPRLIGTTCGRSANPDGVPWGICSDD